MKIKILNFIRKACIYFLRQDYIKSIKKYGKCEIKDDKIVCYVDEKKLKKESDCYLHYDLSFNDLLGKDKKIVEICGLNKPIQYIIENVDFDKKIYINSYGNNELIFKECTFYDHININKVTNITFENNNYVPNNSSYPLLYNKNEIFWISIRQIEDAKCIKFINDKLIATSKCNFSSNVNANTLINCNLHAEKVEIINCPNVLCDILRINTKDLYIENSKIESNESYVTADNICCKNNIINVRNGIIVENKNCNNNFVANINSPYIIYNDEEISEENNYYEEKKYLHQERINLLNILYKIKESCNKNIIEKLNKISNNMNNELVKKTLKK